MRRGGWRRLARASAGAAALEFALLAPVFIALLFGTVEFGRLLWTWQALQETAGAGARCVAIAQGTSPTGPCASGGAYSQSTAQSYVEGIAGQWGVALASGDITPTTNASCGGTSGFAQVSITKSFVSMAPLAFFFPADGVSLTASACYPQNS
ncbi:MAG TPA: TadE family protein [Stellaceae bacterium]|jgi:Flp pilus assembly protein TadG